ncbi:MAG: M1 family metallopeptidase [Bacteroidota bacterium]
MKTKILLLSIIFILFSNLLLTGQETRFFMPYEIQEAYKKGTRSYDGKPGDKYWQNTVDYKIDVRIKPEEKLIVGKEEITYYNNSPDNLNTIVMRLYYDVYKKGNVRAEALKPKDIGCGVELFGVRINDENIELNNKKTVRRRGTNISFKLKKPLKPGESVNLQLSWKQKLPYSNGRTGAYDSTTFFIGQWYPQIAVYDDIFGWDRLDYNLRTEFYNNLANFDVKITIPEEYVLWATGTFQNPEKVLPTEIHSKYKKAFNSDEVIHIIDSTDLKNGFKTINHTWHYTAKEISNFAFAISDHYQWDAGKTNINNKNVLVSSAFPTEKAKNYSQYTAVQQKAMKHFSNDFPGIHYPYEAYTSFIGNKVSGMEYPMMANNNNASQRRAIHELFHSYFPMYVRTNERLWAWMDEGWARYNTTIVNNRYFKNNKELVNVFSVFKSQMLDVTGTIADIPLITSSQFLADENYAYASYPLPATVYGIIHQHLGEVQFLTCYREYINRWAKKSPTPYDFFYTFEDVSKQDLGWIWKPWFFEFGVPDIAIQSLNKSKLTVLNKGQKPVPIFAEVIYNDSIIKIISKSANIWSNGKKTVEIGIPDYKKIKQISVNKTVPDMNDLDNFYPTIQDLYKKINVSEKILGDYKFFKPKVDFEIKKKEGLIYFTAWINIPLYPKSESTLKSLDDSKTFTFQFNDSGECTGIKIKWEGSKYEAEKL